MSNRIFASDIAKRDFSAVGAVKMSGKKLTPQALKKTLIGLSRGGISQTLLKKKLLDAGVRYEQEDKRHKIMQMISTPTKISQAAKPAKAVKVPQYRRALDTSYKKYQYGKANIGVANFGNEKSIGIGKPEAGISAHNASGNSKITAFQPIKPEKFAGGSGPASVSINQKK